MEDRQIMYYLINKNDYLINSIVKELYKDRPSQTRAISVVQKSLKESFLIENNEFKAVDKDWKKHLTAKGMFEYFTMQNKMVSHFFSLRKNSRKSIVTKCKHYLKDLDDIGEREEGYYDLYSIFESNDLLLKKNIIEKQTLDTSILGKEMKLTEDEVSEHLYNMIEKYYLQYYYYKQKEKENPIPFENYLEEIDCGFYSKKIKEIAAKKQKEEMQELVSSEEENDKMIEEINSKKIEQEIESADNKTIPDYPATCQNNKKDSLVDNDGQLLLF